MISIHALREEGDGRRPRPCARHRYFNPRPPRGGRLLSKSSPNFCSKISIHALREEGDARQCVLPPPGGDFNPRPPRGGRPSASCSCGVLSVFQSTPSARRATPKSKALAVDQGISIHALREEGDRTSRLRPVPARNFNPRPPRGGRQPPGLQHGLHVQFQSTPSARRATPTSLPVLRKV